MRIHPTSVLIPLLAGLAACGSTTAVSGTPDLIDVPGHHRLVVMDSPNWDFRWEERDTFHDTGLADCLLDALDRKSSRFTLIPTRTFTRTAFPDLPDELVPTTPEYVRIALTNTGVQDRVQSLNVDYLIYVLGSTEMEHDWGGIMCGVGYGGGGCLGVAGLDKSSNISAVVVDVDSTQEMTNVNVTSSGDSWIAVLAVIPVWHDAPTKDAACRALAEKLDETLQ
ncbi:MAG: hypothetical protein QNI99_08350 [Woeseiaceae bacterium]|nr:hypothetical protein [Woeseiaceae bacterium]